VPPSAAPAPVAEPRLRLLAAPAPRVVDVALWYGERSGGIKTYLDAKASHLGADHHLVVPGRREHSEGRRHELPALTVAASNGYRLPLGLGRLEKKLLELEPDAIYAHDPFWSLPAALRVGAERDIPVIAVHHASSELEAASLRGPSRIYARTLEAWRQREYARADAIQSAAPVNARRLLPLRFGLDPSFRPYPEVKRGRRVLYAGRLSREKGVIDLLDAAALSRTRWPLRIVGTGPAESHAHTLVRRRALGWRTSFEPFISGRRELARAYAEAACVVMPGRFETFGLVALEAAACGARVVVCETAPSALRVNEVAHTFTRGDTKGLLSAIEAARSTPRDTEAAWRIAERNTWSRAFEAEARDLEGLLRT
jgi:alpha-1,6-mannosyltransferase